MKPLKTHPNSAAAPHTHGSPGGHTHPPETALAKVCFTNRLSPEWYAMATAPPTVGQKTQRGRQSPGELV